jgi:hypothetical protein
VPAKRTLNRIASDISPKHPLILSCSYTTAQYDAPQAKTRARFPSKPPAHTSGGYILRDSCQTKARPPAEEQQDRPLIVSPWVKCKSEPLHGLRDLTRSLLSREWQRVRFRLCVPILTLSERHSALLRFHLTSRVWTIAESGVKRPRPGQFALPSRLLRSYWSLVT